ncbi:MAG: hypothetical protein N2C14_22590, partial [Planctomycetales bacterium]
MLENLTGDHFVKALRPVFQDAHHWFPKTRDRAEIRRHALKLRFWPDSKPTDDNGQVLDLNWQWIKSLPGKKVGELRIQDKIGGHDNIRIIFYLGDAKIVDPMRRIWFLAVLKKKRQDFSKANIKIFKARRLLVVERFEKPAK